MYKLNQLSSTNNQKHECIGRHEGEWVIYRCTVCDYELHEHWESDEIRIFNAKQDIDHSGKFILDASENAIENVN